MNWIYTEEQRMTQWWFWLFMTGLGAIPTWGIIQQLVIGKPFGNNPMSDIGLIVFALGVYVAIFFFASIRLITRISKTEIHVHLFPLTRRLIEWRDVETAHIVSYGFVGGYGLRISPKYGTVYNIKGRKGLALVLKDGKKVLIGTQNPEKLGELTKVTLS